jgi:hypothetical protein
MGMSVNITIKIDSDLARAAKVYAAQRGTSVSRLVSEELERLLRRDQVYQAARERAVQRLREAPALGWTKPTSRDELHER